MTISKEILDDVPHTVRIGPAADRTQDRASRRTHPHQFMTLNPDAATRGTIFFSMCRPRTGKDASILIQNPRLVEDRFQSEFAQPVEEAMSVLLRVPAAASAPIMESAHEFAARITKLTVTDVPWERVLMSDLVQHSDTFSFFVATIGPASRQRADPSGSAAHIRGDRQRAPDPTSLRARGGCR